MTIDLKVKKGLQKKVTSRSTIPFLELYVATMKNLYWKQKLGISRFCKSKTFTAQTRTFRNRYGNSNQTLYLNKAQ